MTVYFDPAIKRPEGCRCMVPLPHSGYQCVCLVKPTPNPVDALLAEIPGDTVVFRPLDGKSEGYTAAEMRAEIAAGSELGMTYGSDLLRIARDTLRRQAGQPVSEESENFIRNTLAAVRAERPKMLEPPHDDIPAELTVADFAARILCGMSAHNDSWVNVPTSSRGGFYGLTIRDAMIREFGSHPFGQIAYLAAYAAWNDTEDWARNPHPVEPVTFPDFGEDEETPTP